MQTDDPCKTAGLRLRALHLLAERDPERKCGGVHELSRTWMAGEIALDADTPLTPTQPIPGRPDKPELVPPQSVNQRAMNTAEGRAAMIHAMTHIEFNAINLALDAVWRFTGLPREYYADWLRVADEEAQHFSLLAAHLHTLGYTYGDFTAHDGLWDWAAKTQHDVLARMALLPRTMEARGLDVTPGMRAKLVQAGDTEVAPIMDMILRDEIGHVAIGNRWFNYLCVRQGTEPLGTYRQLASEYGAPSYRGPYNLDARRAAGFSELELQDLNFRKPSRTES